MLKSLTFALTASALAAGIGSTAIVVPSYLDGVSSPDTFNSASTMVDGSGLDVPANAAAGVDLATALTVTHSFVGTYTESWVTNDPAPGGGDYFAQAAGNPTLVFDLGSDVPLGSLILWQYQNNGGDGTSIGNETKNIAIHLNTELEGTTFSGPADATVTMQSVLGLGGTNSAQNFALSGTGRYVQLTMTDNYFGEPGITGGGDRVGLGEIRFDVIPEPSTSLLGGLGLLALLRRRR